MKTAEPQEIEIKSNFNIDKSKAWAICAEYSDDPEALLALINRLEIEINKIRIESSPWSDGMLCVKHSVTINDFTFPYYGSHADAEAWEAARTRFSTKTRIKLNEVKNSILYSVLACVRNDYMCDNYHTSMDDFGYNPDSIKDNAKWMEIVEHARSLQAALRLTEEELNSLPS
jgi:hypothetical protein